MTESQGEPSAERTRRAVDEIAVEGDAATHLEELLVEPAAAAERVAIAGGVPIELVGPHLRVSGVVSIGHHRRLTDFVNNHEGLIVLRDAVVLRRNGDPTRVTAPELWVSPGDVTLIAEPVESAPHVTTPEFLIPKRPQAIIVVTPGHTLTGEVHLSLEAVLSAFIESPSPVFVPMTDVRWRSLADRRVVARYAFALLNRRHIVAATALQPGMVRGRTVL